MTRFAAPVSIRYLAVSFVTLLVVSAASAQISNVTGDQSPPIEGAGHDYIHLLNETVNPVNGALSIRVNGPTPPGRGLSMSFNFGYDSNQAIHYTPQSGWTDNRAYLSQGGWSYVTPRLTSVINAYCEPGGEGSQGCNSLCYWFTDYMLTDLQGGSHALGISPVEEAGQPGVAQCTGAYAPGMVPENFAVGGDPKVQATTGGFSSMPTGGNSQNAPPPVSVADVDGSVYYFSNHQPENTPNSAGSFSLQSFLPDWIEDRNGNKLVFADEGNGVFTVTDTLGRTLLSSTAFGTTNDQISVAGLAAPYKVTWETVSPTTTPISIPMNTVTYSTTGSCPPGFSISQGQPPYPAVKQITLPNGQSYTFQYDPTTTMLRKLTYPTGGYVRYVWGTTPLSEFASFAGCSGKEEQYGTLAVLHRYVSFDGTNEVLQQDFSYYTDWKSPSGDPPFWDYKTTTVTTTVRAMVNGTLTKLSSYNTVYTYGPVAVPTPPNDPQQLGSGSTPVETSIQYYDTNGSLIQTVNKNYLSASLPPTSETTVLANGQTSQTTRTYSSLWQSLWSGLPPSIEANTFVCNFPCLTLLTDQYDYDYGSGTVGPLLRHSHYDYASFKSALFPSGSSYPTSPVPSVVSILDRPTDAITYNPAGSEVAETDYAYDGTAVSSVSSATEHDETNYSTSNNVRGNATTKTVKCLQTGCPNAVATYTYDETGQVLSRTDPCGNAPCSDMTGATHTATYSYADNYTVLSGGSNTSYTPSGNTNAYLTKITDPLGHTANFTYDFNNGQLTKSTDPNSQSTTYLYNDPFDRPTQVNYPDGGETQYAFNDSPYNSSFTSPTPSVKTTQAISSSLNKASTVAFDGMGHTVETILSSDPQGSTYTATSYNGIGKPYQVYNPTRCSSIISNCNNETTWGYTTTNYDALNRVKSVGEQDGSVATTTYDQTNASSSGICTTVTDEAGNSRQSCVDGLGRMTSVWEAPTASGFNFETVYAYDPLNNLLSVTQKGGSSSSNWRIRSFAYDSLSRLTSATNPESGKITYAYDANSNLATKTAPSPNQISTGTATVTTSYSYDVLNRLTVKSYNDSDTSNPATPSVSYGYDGVLLSCPDPVGFAGKSATNGIGRRTAMCFSAGSKSWQYDPMGRISDQNDRFIGLVPPLYKYNIFTNSAGVQSTTTDTEYNYDLNGDLATVYYPGQGIPTGEFYTAENGAGRIITAGDETYHALTNGTYTPDGQLATAEVCNNTCNASNTYNSRLQPVLISTSTTSGTPILNLTYNFNPGTDNGNVIQIANGKDSNRTQNFIYDPLNRIWQAYTNGPNWGETYSPTSYAAGTAFSAANAGIDAWGNLAHRSGVTGKTLAESTMDCPANTNNQLTTCGFGYDPAGNITSNGSISYVYDAENRLIAAGGDSYLYDGDGQRIEKCTEGTMPGTCASNATGTFYWLHVGGGTLSESDLGGNWTAAYGLIGGQIIDRVDLPANVVHYYFHDYLHSTNIVTGSAGNILNESDYYPFGGEIVITSGDSNRYKFTGKERDAESGLDNFGARYYTSSMGRFMTPDWAARPTAVPYAVFGDPQSLNLYTYVRNDPVSRADADGHDDCPGNHVGSAGTNGQCTTVNGSTTGQNTTDANKTAQNQNAVNMSVKVSQQPGIVQNLDLGDGKKRTGVAAQLQIGLTDSNGKPLSGSVKESNKEGGTANPNPIPLSSQGTFKDWVGAFGPASTSVAHVQEDIDNGITVKSTQTLTITTGGATYQADWTRTLTNVDARGKVDDLSITWTTPVIKQISP